MSITLVHSAKGSGVFSSANLTVNVTVVAPASGNVCILACMAPTGVTVAPTLTNVTWSSVTTEATHDGSNTLFVFTGVVTGTSSTALSVLFDPVLPYNNDSVIVQYAEFSGVSITGPIDDFAVSAQTVQTGTTITCTSPSLATSIAADCVVAYLTNLSVGEIATLGSGPTNSFTAINNQSASGGSAGNLFGQLVYQIETSTGSYSTAQNFTQAMAGFNNYSTSIIFALAPPAAAASSAFVNPITFIPGIGSTGL